MTRTFDSAWKKLDWGDGHRKALEAEHERLRNGASDVPVNLKTDWQNGYIVREGKLWRRGTSVARFGDVPQLIDDYPLILGDALHSYRQALDHMVWQLVMLHRPKGSPRLKDRDLAAVQWPSHRSAADFEAWKERPLASRMPRNGQSSSATSRTGRDQNPKSSLGCTS